ncbi:hypothetical protein HPP92_000101 [Vanilla planifolia]|uniref:Dirigent protein n=1 Tax=Vanilla planifolia TaxID=51239 RepID=A0A835RXE6_VANPL|nr:hypothetical protein HPP92_000089 [Vanilla planifolia]KAG0500029.1 hypothetical protein HPP92_000101 [Vanilla planifolia]
MIMNFFFSYGKYNGSTLAILGRNEMFTEVREMPIVGDTPMFNTGCKIPDPTASFCAHKSYTAMVH